MLQPPNVYHTEYCTRNDMLQITCVTVQATAAMAKPYVLRLDV